MNRSLAALALVLATVIAAGCGSAAHPGAPAPPSSSAASPPIATAAAPSATPAPQKRVALYGDGLLDGSGLPDDQSLPYVLTKARPDLLLLDLGLGQESSDKVLTRYRDASEQHLAAVVIWVGTYDAAAGNSPAQYGQSMAQLLDDFKGTPMVLLPPVTLPGGADAGPYAAALAKVAAQRNVAVTDVSAVMRSADWQGDGKTLGPNADAALSALLDKALTVPAPSAPPPAKRVVLIGDSLSYGSELEPPQDLPSVLRSLRPDLDVIDTAVGGQESNDALARARQFTLLHADEAVIWIGTQDSDDSVPIAQYRDNVTKLAQALSPAHVILVPPIADYSTSATGFMPYAAAMRDLARQLGTGLIDVGAPPRSDYVGDGVHLNPTAEARVAAQYAKAL